MRLNVPKRQTPINSPNPPPPGTLKISYQRNGEVVPARRGCPNTLNRKSLLPLFPCLAHPYEPAIGRPFHILILTPSNSSHYLKPPNTFHYRKSNNEASLANLAKEPMVVSKSMGRRAAQFNQVEMHIQKNRSFEWMPDSNIKKPQPLASYSGRQETGHHHQLVVIVASCWNSLFEIWKRKNPWWQGARLDISLLKPSHGK